MRDRGLSRRTLLRLGGLALAGSVLGGRRAAAGRGARPRYVLFVHVFGGMDAIWTLDPRTRAEVDPRVAVPYGPRAICEAGGLRLGPHCRALVPHAATLTVLHGVQARTASHVAGAAQFLRGRLNVVEAMPSLPAILGGHRDTQAVAAVMLALSDYLYGPDWLGVATLDDARRPGDALSVLEGLPPDVLAQLAAVYARRARELRALGGVERARIADELDGLAQLATALPRAPRFRPARWAEWPELGERLQRALWLFEHDLSATVFCQPPDVSWDTHWDNDAQQEALSPRLFAQLARLFGELDRRRNAHGRLADQVLVVVGSEFGRLPYLNARAGKDHLPEMSLLLRGPGLRPGTFGAADAHMAGYPIDLRTGRPQDHGHELTLDDVGASILRWCGVDPLIHGYTGRSLDYLRA